MTALYAAGWLLGLLAAAPALRTGARYELPDRLRDALLLGAAIPFGLGLVGLLYPTACWLVLAGCLVIAYRRNGFEPRVARTGVLQPLPYLTIAALALVAWPQLMRPLLDGDSISYHLPNAAAWSHAHALWTTDPRYWWYPPGSEVFAAGVFTVSGPFALPWCGLGAIALLGFRIAGWAREEFGAPHWLADALAAATITAAPLALQAGTLQNDVWLAAFFLESLWTIRNEPSAAARTLAMTALIKPVGWLMALVAAVACKAPRAAWFASGAALAIWVLHDAVLWNAAIAPAGATFAYGGWQSTILAHGLRAIALLGTVALRASPFALAAMIAAAIGPALAPRPQRALGWAACAAVLLFLALPRAYADAGPQLATGASVRYASPAIVLGALLLARMALLAPRVATVVLIASTAFGVWQVVALFCNDAPTRSALVVAIISVGVAVLGSSRQWRWLPAAGLAIAIVAASLLSARQPTAYYADALAVNGRRSGIYDWIARTAPPTIAGSGLLTGTVNVLDPHARTFDLPDDATCASVGARGALLVAVAETGRSAAFNLHRLSVARACGPVRYDDGLAVAAGF